MKKRAVFYSELAYPLGILLLAGSAALMQRADFGMSVVVAPAYLVYLKLSQLWPAFSFGMAEYLLQGSLILALTLLLRRFKLSYLFSLVTAVLYGFVLDWFTGLASRLPAESFWARGLLFLAGLACCAVGVALFFRTYISPAAYELFVKEVSARYKVDIHKFKTAYDCASCTVGVLLSFLFFGFGHFEGVKLGTVLCALLNGSLIGLCSKTMDRLFDFRDRFPLRERF